MVIVINGADLGSGFRSRMVSVGGSVAGQRVSYPISSTLEVVNSVRGGGGSYLEPAQRMSP